MSNGTTEALNNLIKRIKRIGFGFRNFENYRIRALLYAGKPNWRVLRSIVVRSSRQTPPESDEPVKSSEPSEQLARKWRGNFLGSPVSV